MKSYLIALFAFVALLSATSGEARATTTEPNEPNRIICGLHQSQEQALLASAVADLPDETPNDPRAMFCPLSSSHNGKCPMGQGTLSLSDCCCLKTGGGAVADFGVKDTFGGSTILAIDAPALFGRSAVATYSDRSRYPSRLDPLSSPPPEQVGSF